MFSNLSMMNAKTTFELFLQTRANMPNIILILSTASSPSSDTIYIYIE